MLRMTCFALLSVLLTACATEKPKTIVQTVTVEPNIPLQSRPRPVSLRDVDFFVVTENNFEEFKKRFTDNDSALVFVAFSISDYENLALNLADVQRYIEQQGALIIYYENAIK